MEENETGGEEAKEEQKLGRLQFKLDYDFNSNNVSLPENNALLEIYSDILHL